MGWQLCLLLSQQQLLTSSSLSVSHASAEDRGTEVTEYSFSLGAETAAHERGGDALSIHGHMRHSFVSRKRSCDACTSMGIAYSPFSQGFPEDLLKSDCVYIRKTLEFPVPLHQTPTWLPFPLLGRSLTDNLCEEWTKVKAKAAKLISPLQHLRLTSLYLRTLCNTLSEDGEQSILQTFGRCYFVPWSF